MAHAVDGDTNKPSEKSNVQPQILQKFTEETLVKQSWLGMTSTRKQDVLLTEVLVN